MKKSNFELTDQTYRLTPDGWGVNSIMVNEGAVARATANAFGISIDECDPDGNPNDRPEVVDIATRGGKFYVILKPTNLYRECENPAESRDGSAALYGRWEHFDEEDAEEDANDRS